ncbi:methyltransferase-like protein 24 [Mizuhopecten yessoensis]|uniref:methyltransferase-like protein 24 n=1 Tax=Mizuhopecten yessoensis TaxID=6573 RepID=UPI000B459A84|nr:methyltransferase-like protein 24 [Mizuhopecten yessoensis]
MITSSDNSVNNAFFEELKQDYQCEKNVLLKSAMVAAQNSPVTEDTSIVSTLKSKGDIDYMTIDIGGDEVQLLSWMLTKDLLKNVRQLLVTFHGISANSKASVYVQHLQVLRALYSDGFRTFHFARNVQCLFQGNWSRTGCYSLYMMREMPIIGPLEVYRPEIIKTLPLKPLATLYNRLLMSSQVHCKNVVRIGRVDDGGWDVCNDTEYRPSSPCIVYSFGVGGDWSFEDEVSKIYGCDVHSFDPSIGKPDQKRSDKITFHNLGLWGKPAGKQGKWNMLNLKEIMDMLGHTGKTIDIIKMDIEFSEWEAIPDMVASGVLKNVRQLNFEFHSSPNPDESFRSKMTALRGLSDQGFRLFWSHPNIKGGNPTPFSVTGRQVSSCYENSFLNTNFIKK